MRLVDLLSALRQPSRRSQSATRLTVFGLAIVAAYVSLKASYVPFAWFCLTWFLVLLYLGLTARGSISKAVWLNLSAAVVALVLGELYLWNSRLEKTNTYCCDDLYFVRDDALGVVPRKNFTATHVKAVNSVPIYKVTYTINANGLRIAPPYDVRNVRGSVLFFGCSYTMGDGVADNETIPYMTGLLTHGRYATYNFGFHGYGPATDAGRAGKRMGPYYRDGAAPLHHLPSHPLSPRTGGRAHDVVPACPPIPANGQRACKRRRSP